MSRNARLRVRIVLVQAGTGVMDARRRVAEVLLRAANASTSPAESSLETPANDSPTPSGEKAA